MEQEIRNRTSGLGIRSIAAIVDSAIVFLAWYYTIEILGRSPELHDLTSVTTGGDKVLAGTPALLLLLATAAFWIIPEWLASATLGKLIFGLRVASVDGQQISFVQALQRNILRLIDFFPFYLTGFLTASLTPNHQRLGDLWAKTVVIRRSGS